MDRMRYMATKENGNTATRRKRKRRKGPRSTENTRDGTMTPVAAASMIIPCRQMKGDTVRKEGNDHERPRVDTVVVVAAAATTTKTTMTLPMKNEKRRKDVIEKNTDTRRRKRDIVIEASDE